MRHRALLSLFLLALSPRLLAEDTGISPARLKRAREVLERVVTSRTAGSAIGLIARSGRIVFLESAGDAAPDAISRLASITKPLTAVAVLILQEQGKILLSDPVQKYLPEFAGLKTEDGTSANRPITVHDLLTHEAGLANEGPEYEKLWDARTAREFSAGLARIPLRFQPGTRFEYGYAGSAYDVLTAIIEQVSGEGYDTFLAREVLIPLKMLDTSFSVPESKRSRLAAQYSKGPSGTLVAFRARGQEETPGVFYSGAGGLRSTVSDYLRFAQCLLNRGELDGVRLLSPGSVALVTASHTGSRYPNEHYGWGLGVRVRTSAAGDEPGSVGSYGWNGGTGTLFVVDPAEQLIVIVFVPTVPRTPGVDEARKGFVNAAYQSIVGPPR
jgi:CubicO group peptidase (beta-lactamase class C family)